MTAAIRGEEARWVREDGMTTYTRQNTRLALALLDRVTPVEEQTEILAVVARFDWFVQLLEDGVSARELWELLFDGALPHRDIEARARVRAGLLLSEESAAFEDDGVDDQDWGQDDPNEMEYKSIGGPAASPAAICLPSGDQNSSATAINLVSRLGATLRHDRSSQAATLSQSTPWRLRTMPTQPEAP
jgi:hypothetical protein